MNLKRKIISTILVMIIVIAMLPANILAAVVMDENYSAMEDFGKNYGWNISSTPTHAVFQTLSDGVRILQTNQTRYSTGTTSNTTLDGTYVKKFQFGL